MSKLCWFRRKRLPTAPHIPPGLIFRPLYTQRTKRAASVAEETRSATAPDDDCVRRYERAVLAFTCSYRPAEPSDPYVATPANEGQVPGQKASATAGPAHRPASIRPPRPPAAPRPVASAAVADVSKRRSVRREGPSVQVPAAPAFAPAAATAAKKRRRGGG